MKPRAIVAVLVVACSARGGVAPGVRARAETVVVRGSDTMLPLLQRWAAHGGPALGGLRVQVAGGGSGTGLRALADGTADVAASSRPIEELERAAVAARGRGAPTAQVVALDAVVLYLHTANRIPALDLRAVRALYEGRVDRWSALGGPNLPTVLYGRESSSGTYAFFKEHALHDGDYAPEVQSLPGTASVLAAVARDPGAVGYAGLADAPGVRALPLRTPGGATVAPTLAAVRAGDYPLARSLFLYATRDAPEAARRWIEWTRSPDGQRDVIAAGFVPAPAGGSR